MKPENVKTRQDFATYLAALQAEGTSSWENNTLDKFLGALEAYTNDIDGYYKNNKIALDPYKASWRTLADIIEGAKIYE
ncbi:MAG: hypothetical protein PHD76_00250 [Methylacidiphilales bacterium]|nr:hypothetical protein [Candidatus Methylacidiphilales bacterium]